MPIPSVNSQTGGRMSCTNLCASKGVLGSPKFSVKVGCYKVCVPCQPKTCCQCPLDPNDFAINVKGANDPRLQGTPDNETITVDKFDLIIPPGLPFDCETGFTDYVFTVVIRKKYQLDYKSVKVKVRVGDLGHGKFLVGDKERELLRDSDNADGSLSSASGVSGENGVSGANGTSSANNGNPLDAYNDEKDTGQAEQGEKCE